MSTPAESDLPKDLSRAVTDAMRDQKVRQDRMRHVQEFLTSPAFLDMKDSPLLSSSSVEELQDRRADLKYRMGILESVLAVLIEEMDALDRFLADQAKAAAGDAPAESPEAEPQAGTADPAPQAEPQA